MPVSVTCGFNPKIAVQPEDLGVAADSGYPGFSVPAGLPFANNKGASENERAEMTTQLARVLRRAVKNGEPGSELPH